jgi:hypothetical protein
MYSHAGTLSRLRSVRPGFAKPGGGRVKPLTVRGAQP